MGEPSALVDAGLNPPGWNPRARRWGSPLHYSGALSGCRGLERGRVLFERGSEPYSSIDFGITGGLETDCHRRPANRRWKESWRNLKTR